MSGNIHENCKGGKTSYRPRDLCSSKVTETRRKSGGTQRNLRFSQLSLGGVAKAHAESLIFFWCWVTCQIFFELRFTTCEVPSLPHDAERHRATEQAPNSSAAPVEAARPSVAAPRVAGVPESRKVSLLWQPHTLPDAAQRLILHLSPRGVRGRLADRVPRKALSRWHWALRHVLVIQVNGHLFREGFPSHLI